MNGIDIKETTVPTIYIDESTWKVLRTKVGLEHVEFDVPYYGHRYGLVVPVAHVRDAVQRVGNMDSSHRRAFDSVTTQDVAIQRCGGPGWWSMTPLLHSGGGTWTPWPTQPKPVEPELT